MVDQKSNPPSTHGKSSGFPTPGEWFTAPAWGTYHYRVTFFRYSFCGLRAGNRTFRLGSRESADRTKPLRLCRKCTSAHASRGRA